MYLQNIAWFCLKYLSKKRLITGQAIDKWITVIAVKNNIILNTEDDYQTIYAVFNVSLS